MALTKQTMTDEQRKSVALEYLKAFDRGGVTSNGESILDLFDENAQVYFPKWELATGKTEIGRLFADVPGALHSCRRTPGTSCSREVPSDAFERGVDALEGLVLHSVVGFAPGVSVPPALFSQGSPAFRFARRKSTNASSGAGFCRRLG
jgi:hypothetical protein